MKDEFIDAIHSKNKIRITFHSNEDRQSLTRTCAPMDYGPGTRANNKNDRFHLWDYDSDTARHTLSLLPEQVISIEILTETFYPAEFVTWQPNSIVQRDWGAYS
jgi:hypothetical protein